MDDLLKKIAEIKEMIISAINASKDENDIRAIKENLLSKKSEFSALGRYFRELSVEERIEFGQALNVAKEDIANRLSEKEKALLETLAEKKLKKERLDVTLPGYRYEDGGINPLLEVQDEILSIFVSMGYEVYEGPDIESDYYNFERMNIPFDHPAREMQDSFYLDKTSLMRSHTSPAQARMMDMKKGEPFRVVCPGKCFRRDDDDATHSHQFMQIEGLVIDRGISLADLKGTLELFLKKLFGEKREIRLRGSYFPFTEPSVEVDISCAECGGKGCSICKNTGFIEVLGAGMVHPNVLKMGGYNPNVYSGFAFGVGLDRIAMLKYGISDIRDLYTNDHRFVEQFKKGRF